MEDIECIDEPDGSMTVIINNEEWAQMISEQAQKKGITESEFLSEFLMQYLENLEQDED